jgi:hypothetical protein
MRKILTLALLLSFACSEETEIQCESCINMTISDALPIQFWLNDCQTYNEKESCGVHSFCWNQKFHCDDEIRLQISDTTQGTAYALQLLDESGDLIIEMPFSEEEVFSDTDILPPLQFSNTSLATMDDWSSLGGSDRTALSFAQWQAGTGGLDAMSASNYRTQYLGTSRPNLPELGWPPGEYVVSIRAVNTGEGSGVRASVYGMAEDGLSQTSISSVSSGDFSGLVTRTLTFTLDQYYPLMAFAFQVIDGPGFDIGVYVDNISITSAPTTELRYTRSIYEVSFTPSELSPEICNEKVQFQIVSDTSPDEVAKSDFVEFSDNLQCTELIKYRNQRNFAGIDYVNLHTDTSPDEDLYFYLRVPAVFFHQRFPGEDETIELSDSKIINVNGVMRAQRLFDTDYMPYYMHKKIGLILKHQFVEIASARWTKQDAYEIAEGNKRYPLKRAECWLTERDFVARNVV